MEVDGVRGTNSGNAMGEKAFGKATQFLHTSEFSKLWLGFVDAVATTSPLQITQQTSTARSSIGWAQIGRVRNVAQVVGQGGAPPESLKAGREYKTKEKYLPEQETQLSFREEVALKKLV